MKRTLALTLGTVILVSACGKQPETQVKAPPVAESSEPNRAHLDAARVSFSMRGNEEDYRKCFMQAIGSRGAVSLAFTVDTRGAVDSTSLKWSSLNNPRVEGCLRERLTEQKFGEQSAPAQGSWTFVFRLTDPIDEKEREKLLKKAEDEDENAFAILPGSVGTIDAHHLDEIIQLKYPLYAHCYRDSIRRRGQSQGLVRFQLKINESGELTELVDAGTVLPDPFAVDCMAEAFYAIDFPRPSGGAVSLRYGLDLE